MIKKIIKLKSLSKFHDYSAGGDVEFKKSTLIFAENGKGKSSLCDVFRSLSKGQKEIVHGRATLGKTDIPSIEILTSDGVINFKQEGWERDYKNIVVFDNKFIDENVYSGLVVDHEHKKNLYRIIIGEQGVKLAKKVDELDEQSRLKNKELQQKKEMVTLLIPKEAKVDDFLVIPIDSAIDQKISEKKSELDALESADEILKKGELSAIRLPILPDNFSTILSKNIEGLSKETEELVKNHLTLHTNGANESWLSDGVNYIKDNKCPFCYQNVGELDLIKQYQSYFSQSYKDLQNDIISLRDSLESAFGGKALLGLQKIIDNNSSSIDFWTKYIGVIDLSLSFETDVEPLVNALFQTAEKLIDKKKNTPLESVSLDQDGFNDEKARYDALVARINIHNGRIREINVLINNKKTSITGGDIAKVRKELEALGLIKLRHGAKGIELCNDYVSSRTRKEAVEKEKQDTKNELDAYSETMFKKYQTTLNDILEKFNADFRIVGAKGQYIGGTASSHYQIVINNVPIDLGDSKTPENKPSFKNTLSGGDKSALALALFLSHLEQDQTVSEKIVILDDPFTSQDRFRRGCTKDFIIELSGKAKQVVVLSHEPSFLKLIWDDIRLQRADLKTLQLSRIGQSSAIAEWDIEAETKGEYERNLIKLKSFISNGVGDKKDFIRTLRPFLEQFLRLRFPGVFPEGHWLGDMIGAIRKSAFGNSLAQAQSILSELEAINEYSKTHHHGNDTDPEPIDDSELQGYVKRTLKIVEG